VESNSESGAGDNFFMPRMKTLVEMLQLNTAILKLDLDSNWPKIKSGRKASFFHTIGKNLFEVGEKSAKILQKCMKKLAF
jgi:hypothetical protein